MMKPNIVSIRDDPIYKQFQVESTVPHGVICSCQVQNHYPRFFIVLKAVFESGVARGGHGDHGPQTFGECFFSPINLRCYVILV